MVLVLFWGKLMFRCGGLFCAHLLGLADELRARQSEVEQPPSSQWLTIDAHCDAWLSQILGYRRRNHSAVIICFSLQLDMTFLSCTVTNFIRQISDVTCVQSVITDLPARLIWEDMMTGLRPSDIQFCQMRFVKWHPVFITCEKLTCIFVVSNFQLGDMIDLCLLRQRFHALSIFTFVAWGRWGN